MEYSESDKRLEGLRRTNNIILIIIILAFLLLFLAIVILRLNYKGRIILCKKPKPRQKKDIEETGSKKIFKQAN